MNGRKARALRKAHPHTPPHVPAAIPFEPRSEDDRGLDGPIRPRTRFFACYQNGGQVPVKKLYYRPTVNRALIREGTQTNARNKRRIDRRIGAIAFAQWRYDHGFTLTLGAPKPARKQADDATT